MNPHFFTKDWRMPPRKLKKAANQFAIIYGKRFMFSEN
jgi:transposase-like protein